LYKPGVVEQNITGEYAVDSLETKIFNSHKGGGRGRMVVGIITTSEISVYHN
jgi:hypothetical protein